MKPDLVDLTEIVEIARVRIGRELGRVIFD